jgi:hypothetical protein
MALAREIFFRLEAQVQTLRRLANFIPVSGLHRGWVERVLQEDRVELLLGCEGEQLLVVPPHRPQAIRVESQGKRLHRIRMQRTRRHHRAGAG